MTRPLLHGLLLALLVPAVTAVRPAAAQSATHAIVITGIGGEPQYQTLFFDWGAQLTKALTGRWGVPREQVVFLTEQPERDPALVSGRSTKEEIGKAFAAVRSRAGVGDVVFIMLIGHGSYQSGESRLSLPGPDLSAVDFANLVGGLAPRRVVLVNAASASGEFVRHISGPDRIIITATKSGMERNQARFGGYFVQALAEDGADTDKDGAVSMLEAFSFASAEVRRSYESERTLLTEHAVLDDDGDGKGSDNAGEEGAVDGALARVTFLGSGAVAAGIEAPPGASPALRALYEQKKELEKRIADLRAVKDTMDPERYERELEALLVELALKNQEIRRMEGGTR